MKKIALLFAFIGISILGFSQKIEITNFTNTSWEKVYETESIEFYYMIKEGSLTSKDTKTSVEFKIVNKSNSNVTLNANTIVEYANLKEKVQISKSLTIAANSTIEGKTEAYNLRIPLHKKGDSTKTLKSIKIDF
jgi:hypothetical protein